MTICTYIIFTFIQKATSFSEPPPFYRSPTSSSTSHSRSFKRRTESRSHKQRSKSSSSRRSRTQSPPRRRSRSHSLRHSSSNRHQSRPHSPRSRQDRYYIHSANWTVHSLIPKTLPSFCSCCSMPGIFHFFISLQYPQCTNT